MVEMETTLVLNAPEGADMALVVGPADRALRVVQECFRVRLTVRGDSFCLTGDAGEVDGCSKVLEGLFGLAADGRAIGEAEVRRLAETVRESSYTPAQLHDDIVHAYRGKAVRPKTAGQKAYVDAIRSHTITFGLGPAGTGKTFLACAVAAAQLAAGNVKRIVLCRPIVEAGESLGFLPGTLMEKVDPYNRPLYDALFEMLDAQRANRMLAEGVIEIVPLAYMRGRTFNGSFIILDEAQNATPEQMKLFLTRLGFGSKMVITGDESQSDFAGGPAGLAQARRVLADVDDIAFCTLSGRDVVRHELVARIVEAYERG